MKPKHVKIWLFAPDRRVYVRKVKPGPDGKVVVKLSKNDEERAYLIPMDQYHAGQREFTFRLDEALPFDLAGLTEVPPKMVLPLAAAAMTLPGNKVGSRTISDVVRTFLRQSISRDRAGRAEMAQILSGRLEPEYDVTVQLPGDIELHCTLEEIQEALEGVEGGQEM